VEDDQSDIEVTCTCTRVTSSPGVTRVCTSGHSRTVRSDVMGSVTMNKRSDVGISLVGGARVMCETYCYGLL